MTPRRQIAVVVNPVATRASAVLRARVTRALAPLGRLSVHVTTGPGDAARLTATAAAGGADLVVSLGGDGTASEAAGALAGGPVALVPLPAGNANVFARALGWPATPDRALARLVGLLDAAPRWRDAHLGRMRLGDRERVVVVNAGMGIDAATVGWIEARPAVKRRARQLGFAAGAVVSVARSDARLEVVVDGGPPRPAVSVVVAVGCPYVYVGPWAIDLVPGADFAGPIAWRALARSRPGEIAGLVLGAVRGRPPDDAHPVAPGGLVRSAITARAEFPTAVQADGEPLGHHREMTLSPGPILRTLDPRG